MLVVSKRHRRRWRMHRIVLHRTAGGRGDPAHRGPPSARWPARGPAVAQHGRRRALPFDRFLHLIRSYGISSGSFLCQVRTDRPGKRPCGGRAGGCRIRRRGARRAVHAVSSASAGLRISKANRSRLLSPFVALNYGSLVETSTMYILLLPSVYEKSGSR